MSRSRVLGALLAVLMSLGLLVVPGFPVVNAQGGWPVDVYDVNPNVSDNKKGKFTGYGHSNGKNKKTPKVS